jgi:threonine aldolase
MKTDLRSDTVTRPTHAMMEAMMAARVGDDVFGDDPTVIALEQKASALFGMEAALFCPSGTMANQIAIKAHTQPGDEVICDLTAHVYNYEGGGIAFNAGCSVKLLQGDRGRFGTIEIASAINPDDIHYPVSRLVVVENTSNKGGGSCFSLQAMQEISALCKAKGLQLHLDGARIFNAITAKAYKPQDIGLLFNSISMCFSKGLGAPVGSILLGDTQFIARSRRLRKVLGGAMRQSGYLAAAAIYALDNNIERLKEDHRRASRIEDILKTLTFVDEVLPVETNIIIFKLAHHIKPKEFLAYLRQNDILAAGFGGQSIRFVTHLDFTDEMLEHLLRILLEFKL